MKFILPLLIICASFYSKTTYSQENKSFKVTIGEHGLHCPNLGPKLKININQIGGEIIYFNIETSIMLINLPTKDTEKANKDYLETIIQLTGYPDKLITIEELTAIQMNEFIENTTSDEK